MTTPAHVAIIMDGNGRWAKARGMPRLAGHRAGVEALRKTVRAAPELGISFLTVYAFSSENWSRPKSEVSDLMGLLKLFIRRDLAELHQNGVRVRVIGDREGLQPDIRGLLQEAESLTAGNEALTLVIAFNYGGRDEIVRTARKLAAAVARGDMDCDAITAESFAGSLDTNDIPDPDLVIRTSGELRLSNFLLWQAAYSELVFLPCYWPDFNAEYFAEALRNFAGRERRYGGLAAHEVAS
ncbi:MULTISPECIES: isoprenyl transferase [unclassified Mesorhizobium]|uniref:isoprenyl transferase n=1 Tax=unclassified Mesorhizobium TaxID=325217 RepID=UPI000BAFE7EA|nr:MULTISPECIES: isoprenyl transferase [unclassified Mesorhizobium]TGT59868.1 isoprenyl transferase [Mesorhizobium sp. M00.F.Ca.ET.170.01.1.1]AZO08024.1 isoprenyl transferase [Mesorhizobium sp. M3A.F.Ca.ET.080.04.2.1]PBB87025.1 di-trans,poly-cis-decaprenylcistransferase [Mesorhizobium sp. WSM3876]RWB70303.1 MAG: isoprenyl transferase [Mesorhizobium sp.]RWB91366.1 MAG: isoprenyl transferase [Mesorhizobium sp.]